MFDFWRQKENQFAFLLGTLGLLLAFQTISLSHNLKFGEEDHSHDGLPCIISYISHGVTYDSGNTAVIQLPVIIYIAAQIDIIRHAQIFKTAIALEARGPPFSS